MRGGNSGHIRGRYFPLNTTGKGAKRPFYWSEADCTVVTEFWRYAVYDGVIDRQSAGIIWDRWGIYALVSVSARSVS